MFKWENIVKVGTIVEINSQNKALVRVKTSSRTSDFLPVVMVANSFKRHWQPVCVGEQVTIFCPFGNPNFGLVFRSIFNKGCKEPAGASEFCEVVEYEDGTRFTYDTRAKKLTMFCVGDVEIVAKNISIKAINTNFDGGSITHNGTTIDDTHDHTQTDGNHFGGGAITTPPNK